MPPRTRSGTALTSTPSGYRRRRTTDWADPRTARVQPAVLARDRLLDAPVELCADVELAAAASAVADQLGWAKTYDAEYVALAEREDVALLTVDTRLARGAGRLVRVVTPSEL